MRRPQNPTYEKALERMRVLCDRSEQSAADVGRRLHRMRLSADDAESIIAALTADGLIDDARYARAFVEQKYRYEMWGVVRIEAALRMRHIATVHIRQAVEAIDREEYHAVLRRLLESRLRHIDATDTEAVHRLIAVAVRRGYTLSQIRHTLRQLISHMRSSEYS